MDYTQDKDLSNEHMDESFERKISSGSIICSYRALRSSRSKKGCRRIAAFQHQLTTEQTHTF